MGRHKQHLDAKQGTALVEISKQPFLHFYCAGDRTLPNAKICSIGLFVIGDKSLTMLHR